MMASLLTRIGLPVLIRIVAGSLRDLDNETAKYAAGALDDVDRALLGGHIPPEQLQAGQKHLQKMAELEAAHLETAMEEINTSLRAEIESHDPYVRRMRPTFGYLMAFTWAAQMLGLAYIIIFKTEQANDVLNAMSSLGTIWTVGLSVLGIYVYKRSQDKKINVHPNDSLLKKALNIPFPHKGGANKGTGNTTFNE